MTLDPANPLVLDTRPLHRRAGTMLVVEREFPAPGGWGISTAEVPAGGPVELQARLEAVVEGVLVTATAIVPIVAECSRCLDRVDDELEVSLQQLFEYPDHADREAGEDDQLPVLVGELLDLEPILRDGVVLDLPLVPLCSPDCPGLCAVCGARLADDPHHRHALADDRWAALSGWSASTDEAVFGTAEPDNEKGL